MDELTEAEARALRTAWLQPQIDEGLAAAATPPERRPPWPKR